MTKLQQVLYSLCWGASLSSMTVATPTPEHNAFWGEQHVHTSWSFDAFAFGNQLTGPRDFCRYAKGEAITHPGGNQARITRPLDCGAVTEHSDYMGLVQQASDPDLRHNRSKDCSQVLWRLGFRS
jgi:hypothetical protein